MTLDAAAGGSLMSRSQNEAYNLIDEMALNQQQYSNERSTPRVAGRFETDFMTKVSAQMDSLQQQLSKLNVSAVTQSSPCSMSGGTDHLSINCQMGSSSEGDMEQANALNNFRPQNNPYNTYNPGWRNHPNFSWRNEQPQPNQN